MNDKEIKVVRKIIACSVFVIFIISFIKILPIFLDLTTEEGREVFKIKLQSLGTKGAITIIALQICKIVLVFLPGEPIELLAGMSYGTWIGLLLIYIGVSLSNILIIFSVKKYGVKLVNDVVPEEKRIKVENFIHENPDGAEITLIILYLLPALPKDFITYVVSLSPIEIKKILIISVIGRFPAVFSSVLAGSRLINGDIKSVIMVYLITYVISGLIVFLYKNSNRKGKTNE